MYKREEAVSPVIGVILMVAITVILAAVIAAFVFGMTGNVKTTKNIGITVEQKGTGSFTVTNFGGADVNKLTGVIQVKSGATTGTLGTSVGSTKTLSLDTTTKRVIVTGTFSDGSTSVLLDRTF